MHKRSMDISTVHASVVADVRTVQASSVSIVGVPRSGLHGCIRAVHASHCPIDCCAKLLLLEHLACLVLLFLTNNSPGEPQKETVDSWHQLWKVRAHGSRLLVCITWWQAD